jgi:hypothetical protein
MQADLKKNIDVFSSLGGRLRAISSGQIDAETEGVIAAASTANPWFTRDNILNALGAIGRPLIKEDLEKWLMPYAGKTGSAKAKKTVGVINAGNIPAVGFYDFLCVLMSGNIYHGKNSSDDLHLLPFIASLLKKIEPWFEGRIFFVDRISNPDAVIATGSNNSARYFNYYFGKYPHIIRKNRNGVAVLDGSETAEELSALADDLFRYFGLGCRSVSKIFVPEDFDARKLFPVFEKHNSVSQHSRYMNNYNYQRVVLMMQKFPFLENGFLILRENESLHSPISVLHYELYKNAEEVFKKLSAQREEVQCVACGKDLLKNFKLEKSSLVPLGQTQNPKLWDYADGVDTMEFLIDL